jgi:hypothetical protein
VFRKLLGWWRKPVEIDTDEPPAAAAPARHVRPAAALVPPEKKETGFDPYNSGAFKRQNAWERVPRL